MDKLHNFTFVIIFAPLLGCLLAGFLRNQIGRQGAHTATITGVALSFLFSLVLAKDIFIDHDSAQISTLYTWASGGTVFPYSFSLGFLVDQLTVLMMLVVTFVSLLVHIYSIGYMEEDDGYQRFFSYISLFTFFMLLLISANNFLQLFIGWEGVGLVSYLLIGFWFKRESAIQGNLKAFLVNRVGDFGFLLGIGMILAYVGSLDYVTVFSQVGRLTQTSISLFPGTQWSVITVTCILLFIGAMGKSAQMPLHVWLPESMEGPTPISALIHAATMVTAGVFMVARLSPLFEQSETALSFILIIGASGALFTGLIAIVMNDIKRVVAYSTLSQLGYMMAGLGASAYSAGIFHLATHAAFKALLFLGAGSVIIAMHHEQDMRKMGGLWKHMPITYATYVIGSLALVAFPPFAGFYSKDLIIEAVGESHRFGAHYAYFCVMTGAFVTSLYTFRSLFMTFHGKERMDAHTRSHLHETPWVVCGPLIALAVPSVLMGMLLVYPMVFAQPGLLGKSIFVLPEHNVIATLATHYEGWFHAILEAIVGPVFWLTMAGFAVAWFAYIAKPELPAVLAERFSWAYRLLLNKYGFDSFNDFAFVRGSRRLGQFLFGVGDQQIIDGAMVNGLALGTRWLAFQSRLLQSGYLYHYATMMVVGLLIFLTWLLLG